MGYVENDWNGYENILILIFVLKERNKYNFTNANIQQETNMHMIYNNCAYIRDVCSKMFYW